VGGSAYHLAPITNWMVVKIIVDDTANVANLAQYPLYQIGMNEGTGTTDFDVAEIIGYDHTLTTEEENKLGSWLSYKYNLTTTYPIYVPPAPKGTVLILW
jgi:hypothetical protein